MIVIYTCVILFTLTCESLPLDKEYIPNVGSVLFSARDAQKKQWGTSKLGLLQARRYFQNILPPPIFANSFNEQHVDSLLGYFRDAYATIKKEAKDPETDTIMTTALSDAIGGYLKAWVLPVAKLDYYGGTISQTNVIKIFQFYNELKRYLNTDGDGWHTPDEKALNSITINVAPLQLFSNTRSMKNACDYLAYFEKTPTGLTIPIPNVNWNGKSSTLFVPLKNASLIFMNSPGTGHNLAKYYHIARSCIQTSHPKEQEDFDQKFQEWLINEVVPHLKDDHLYLSLGSVLTLVNRSGDVFDSALDFHENKCKPVCNKKKSLISIPCDISYKKIWILTVILIIEIAWCIPALAFVIWSKKKDCSSHVYLFMDNDKKDKGKPKLLSIDVDDTSTRYKCVQERCIGNPAGLKVIRNTEYIVPNPSASPGVSLNRSRSSSRAIEYPELYCDSKKSSLKKPSAMSVQECSNPTQILALSSNDTFSSKQSGTKSRHFFPPLFSRSKILREKDECKNHKKHIKMNDNCFPNHSKKSEEYNDCENSVEFQKCKKYDESKDCIVEIRKQTEPEARKKFETRKKLEEYQKMEDRKQFEEYKKAEQRRILEECRISDERKKALDRKIHEDRKKAEEGKILHQCKKFGESKKAVERKRFEQRKKLQERKRHEDHKIRDECKMLEDYKKLEKNSGQQKQTEGSWKRDECREVDENELAKLIELEELNKLKKAADRFAYDCNEPVELGEFKEVDLLSDNVVCLDNDKMKQFEECRDFDQSGNPDYQSCDHSRTGSCSTQETCLVKSNQNADNFNKNNYDDYNELTCCHQVSSQKTCAQAMCPCTECLNKVSATKSNDACCEKSLSEIMHIPDKQVKPKSTSIQVTKELKRKGGKHYLEITIDRPGTEICIDMSKRRTHNSPYRPSKIPSERQPYILVDKHKNLPQRKKITADDMDLRPTHCSKSIQSKLNGSF